MTKPPDALAVAVAKLIESLDGGPRFLEEDWNVVLAALTRVAQSGPYAFSRPEAVEIALSAVTRFIDAVRAGNVDRARGATGYLIQAARNEAADAARRRQAAPVFEPLPEDVDAAAPADSIDDLLGRLADDSLVRAAMRRAKEEGRHEISTFIRVFIDLAEHGTPTLRELGHALELSPSTVSDRMRQLREILENL